MRSGDFNGSSPIRPNLGRPSGRECYHRRRKADRDGRGTRLGGRTLSLGLPPAIAGHNNYFVWGPRGHDGSVIIIIGGDTRHYADLFRSTEVVGRISSTYAMPYETDQPIYVLRGMKMPLQEYWPQMKSYR